MRPFPNALKKTLQLALGLAGGVGMLHGVRFIRENLKGDPLAQFRAPRISEYPDTLGLRLSNVRVRRYVGKKVEAEFVVRGVDVEKNRHVFRMTGIQNGVYHGEKEAFRFAAGSGYYNGFGRLLNLQNKVKVTGKEFDLSSQAMEYNAMTKKLTVASKVSGKAWGGVVRAERVTYDTDKKIFTSGPAMWRGKIPEKYLASMGISAGQGRNAWQIETDGTSVRNGDISTANNATVSDKEVIVRAPKVTINHKTDIVVATGTQPGSVRYWSGDANFVADKATVLRKEKRVILEGNVRMLVKTKAEKAAGPKIEEVPPYTALPPEKVEAGKALPKPADVDRVRSGKSVRDYPLVIVGSKVDYSYARGSRLAIITGSPQARQELGDGAWRQVWTNSARYDAENEILRLNGTKGKGDARMKNSIGDDLTANWFELSTTEGEDEYSGEAIRGTVTTTDDEEPAGGSGSGARTGTTGGGGTPPPPPRRRR